jgi:tetratricopeptide (TPR) repeat protein
MAAAASGGDSATVPRTFIAQTRPLAPASTAAPEAGLAGIDVAGMFGELKQELENGGTPEGEDSETHYNLGVAFREMGLLDEAIGEFQKVCQAVDHGHPFPQLMQTYTWLAQCFLDRGVPEAAIPWYERALELPNLDGETRVALHYELAGSYEAAQNRTAAMKHFLEVYGNNIDYRDVAERIRALKS